MVKFKVLQKLFGHASIKTTMDRYVHVTGDSLSNGVRQFADDQIASWCNDGVDTNYYLHFAYKAIQIAKWCRNGGNAPAQTPQTIENKGDVKIYEIRYCWPSQRGEKHAF